VIATLRLYGREASRALRLAARGWPVAFSLLLYAALMLVAAKLLLPLVQQPMPLGLVGSLLLGLAGAACISSYLDLLSGVVAGRKVTLTALKQSFGARFWDAVSVLFAFWIINFLLGTLTRGMGQNGLIMRALAGLTMVVFFNPVPELLYRGSSRSFALLGDAARFISAHGLEWLPPNLLIAAALLWPSGLLQASSMGERVLLLQSLFSPLGVLGLMESVPILALPLLLLAIHWAMVFRGLLFGALESGGARRRDLGDFWRR
jgi:hypothetical protein